MDDVPVVGTPVAPQDRRCEWIFPGIRQAYGNGGQKTVAHLLQTYEKEILHNADEFDIVFRHARLDMDDQVPDNLHLSLIYKSVLEVRHFLRHPQRRM